MSLPSVESGESGHSSCHPTVWHQQKHDSGGFCMKMKLYFAKHGNVEQLKWMYENCDAELTTEAMDGAATNGHLDVVKYIDETPSKGCLSMQSSASSFVDMKQLWNWCTGAKCTTAAMDGAAMNGHLSVVKWLHKNREEGCTTSAMDNAATNGHFNIVMWLHCNRQEGCTTAAIDGAASNGYLLVMDWLRQHRSEGCTASAMINAASKGFLEVVKFLHINLNQQATNAAVTAAASNGHLSVVQYLHENHSERCTADAVAEANKIGHQAVVQFLLQHEECGRAYDEGRFVVSANDEVVKTVEDSASDPDQDASKAVFESCEDTVDDYTELEARLRAEEEAKIRIELGPRIRAEVEAAIRAEQEEALTRARIRKEIQPGVEKKMRTEIRAELLANKKAEECAICFGNFDDPITTACGHTFCSGCLKKWRMRRHEFCPMCRSPLN